MAIKKKKDLELMFESSDLDRGFNPFLKKSSGEADISLCTFSSIDQVIYFN